MTTSSKLPVIGVAGTLCSGQDAFGEYLEGSFGYYLGSTSDLVRKEALRLAGSIERPILQEIGRALRYENGAGYFVDLALGESKVAGKPPVVTGIRTLGEVASIEGAGGLMVFTDAPADQRYERMVARKRDGESALSFDEFMAREAIEYYQGDKPEDFNRRDIEKLADYKLENAGSIEEFHVAINGLMARLTTGKPSS
jgi:dephospho-CoA kinase